MAAHSLELVHINYLCLEPGKGKEENVLLVKDHSPTTPRHVTQSQTAQTMVKALWDNFIIHKGLPEKILLDQGRNVEESAHT